MYSKCRPSTDFIPFYTGCSTGTGKDMNALILALAFCTLTTGSAQQNKVDLRTNKCWPPVAPELELIKNLNTPGGPPCLIFARPLAAVSVAEYVDCMASRTKTLRTFSRLQVVECALPQLRSCGSLPTSKPISGVDYVANVGLELDSVYNAKHETAHASGEVCHFNGTGKVFIFKSGVNVLPRKEKAILANSANGPVLVNLYMNSTRAFPSDPNDLTSLANYQQGILDTDYFCPAKTTVEALKINPSKGIEAVKMPATIVGYDRISDGTRPVDVWIGRIDYFGPSWGMHGYFYMRRGSNACNMVANAIQILG